jgi:restriction system protein
MIPEIPKFYINREEIEEQIRRFLIGKSDFSTLQVIGLGGIGKTTIVAKVLFDTKSNDRATWFNLYEEPNIKESLREHSDEIERNYNFGRPIIVLDGAETILPETLVVYLNHFRDRFPEAKMIITSRMILNRSDSKIVALDAFSQEQTAYFLSQWNRNNKEIIELHEIAQGHPLLLNMLNSRLDFQSLDEIKNNLNFKEEISKRETNEAFQSKIIQVVKPKIITLKTQIVERIKERPQDVYRLTPREYEELIAELITDFGWKVELTPQTRDGGKDILASYQTELGTHLCLIEAKKYRWERPIGVSIVRELYGTLIDHQANSSLLVTSSRFSPEAIKFQQRHEYLIGLKDYFDVLEWIGRYKNTAYNNPPSAMYRNS